MSEPAYTLMSDLDHIVFYIYGLIPMIPFSHLPMPGQGYSELRPGPCGSLPRGRHCVHTESST